MIQEHCTFRYQINGGGGGQNLRERSGIFVKFNKQGVKVNGEEGRNFKISVDVGNVWKKRHKCLILMINLKVIKQARSEASKNKVIIKRVLNISTN